MSEAKVFTAKSANQTLPLVRKIVDDILLIGSQIREISARVGSGAESDPEVVKRIDQLEDLFDELEELGCFYKDWNFSVGLVDFPARIEGEEVFLCWRSDEPDLKYYHPLDGGFAGRQPIPAKYLK